MIVIIITASKTTITAITTTTTIVNLLCVNWLLFAGNDFHSLLKQLYADVITSDVDQVWRTASHLIFSQLGEHSRKIMQRQPRNVWHDFVN